MFKVLIFVGKMIIIDDYFTPIIEAIKASKYHGCLNTVSRICTMVTVSKSS